MIIFSPDLTLRCYDRMNQNELSMSISLYMIQCALTLEKSASWGMGIMVSKAKIAQFQLEAPISGINKVHT